MSELTPILSADLMRKCDNYTIEHHETPSQVLMERAAMGVVEEIEKNAHLYFGEGCRVLVLCGGGNNGGDGFAVARFLQKGTAASPREVTVCYCGALTADGRPDMTRMSEECARQYGFAQGSQIPISTPSHAESLLDQADLIVDALFGIGLDRPIIGLLAHLMSKVNEKKLPVIAVDIPSGIHSDTGEIMGAAIKATTTVTMQAPKAGLFAFPGADFCGKIIVRDIGIDLSPASECKDYVADTRLLCQVMPPRARRSHKGTYGRLALVCGSRDMSGAAILSVQAAMRTGAGLLQIITPECNRIIMQVSVPEAILSCYDDQKPDLRALTASLASCDGAVIGCGLGTSDISISILGTLLNILPIRPDFPVILDADALNLLAKHPWLWETRLLTEGREQVIITPHPMEMSRLTNIPVKEILRFPKETALAFAKERGICVVLKDAHTVIASPDNITFICPFGNAGMAKGGCGDVLAGILGSLAVQRRGDIGRELTLTDIAAAGVTLHALSGDTAAKTHGEYAMTPSDIISCIGQVTLHFSDSQTKLINK